MSLFLINPYIFAVEAGVPPDDIPNLDIWWDPSDSSNRTTSGSNLLGLTNKGSGGSASLLGPAGSSTSGASVPVLITINSIEWADYDTTIKNVLRLPGTNTVYPRGSASCAMMCVFRSTQSTGWITLMMQGLTGGSSPGWALQVNNSSTAGTMNNPMRDDNLGTVVQTADAIDTSAYDGNTHTLAMVKDMGAGANGELSTYFDGSLLGTASAIPASYGNIDETYSSPWNDLMIGARPAGGSPIYQNFVDAQMGDHLIYGQALTSTNVSDLHAWLLAKWGS